MSNQDRVFVRGIPANHPLCAVKFLNEVIKLSEQGYKLLTEPKTSKERASFIGFPSCVMIKDIDGDTDVSIEQEQPVEAISDTTEVVSEDKGLLEQVSALSGKKDLMDFAEKHGIEIPVDVKVPKAIQKYIIDKLNTVDTLVEV